MGQLGVLRAQVNDATDDADAILDWLTKLRELILAQVLLEETLKCLKLALQVLGTHLRSQVEVVISLTFTALKWLNLDLTFRIVDTRDFVD